MELRKFNPPIQLVSHQPKILWIICWVSFILLLLIPLLDFYPFNFRIIFAVFFVLFAITDLKYPLLSTFLLAGSGFIFGNHPGGRFLELQDCLWIFWSIRGIIEAGIIGFSEFIVEFWKKRLTGFLLIFFLISIFSLISNPDIIRDTRYYNKGWFWFLHSTELEPWYPMKLIFIGILFLFGLVARSQWLDKQFSKKIVYITFSYGVAFGLITSISIGLIENFFPIVRSYLDSYHYWLDAYKVVSPHRSFIPNLDKILPTIAIQSTYWNRSWFSISIISSLPFFFYSLGNSNNNKKVILYSFSIIVIGITLILTGARGAILSFLAFLIVSFIHNTIQNRLRNNRTIQSFSKLFSIFLIFSALIFPILIVWMDGKLQSQDRLMHYVTALDIGSSKPILGGGFESYGWYNECCLSTEGRASFYHTAHNQFLQIFSGLGFIGLIVYCLLWFFLLENMRSNFTISDRKKGYTESAIYGSIIAIFIYSFFQEWFYLRAVYLQWIAMFLVFPKKSNKNSKKESSKSNKNSWIAFGTVIIAALIFVSITFYPTTNYRKGIYFPPGQDPTIGWILEGEGFNTIKAENQNNLKKIIINVESILPQVYLSLELETQKEEIKFGEISELKSFTFNISEIENILHFKCILNSQSNNKNIQIWEKEIKNPEPRKFCAKFQFLN